MRFLNSYFRLFANLIQFITVRKIVYYVATSIDGFISGENDDVNGFIPESDGITQYLADLKEFDTVIMGRRTYEFGYKYGMSPGQVPPLYSHMKNYVFSNSFDLPNPDPQVKTVKLDLKIIDELRAMAGTTIYLCGGGKFAGWLLNNERIDILKIKLNPVLLGKGIPMFENLERQYKTELLEHKLYSKGLQIISYKLIY